MKTTQYFEKRQKEIREKLDAEKRAKIQQSIDKQKWEEKQEEALNHLLKIARISIQNGNFVQFNRTDGTSENIKIIELQLNLMANYIEKYTLSFSGDELNGIFKMILSKEDSGTSSDKSYTFDSAMSLSSLEEDFVGLLNEIDESN